MRHPTRRHAVVGVFVGALALTGTLVGPSQAAPEPDEAAAAPYKVLVVGKTLGFRHSHIDETTNAVIALGEEHGFTVDVWDPPNPRSPGQPALTMPSTPFTTAESLGQYATIVFASNVDGTNDQNPARPRTLDDAELSAFQGYIRNGGGFVGLHAATDAMHAVPWYSQLTGGAARFRNHPAQQTATMRVESPTHPSTEMLPKEWVRFDEWYNFTSNPRADVHVLLTLDESTYSGGSMGADHPISWCHNFEGGRSWYEGAGHVDSAYSDPLFLDHLLGGIEWTAGVVNGGGDCVTFPEVNEINEAAGAGGNPGADQLSSDVAEYLAAAETAHNEGRHAAAAHTLKQAKGKAQGLHDDALVAKIADLITWQQGLVGF
jgi:type 1 glutamine amidotransferase